MLYGEKLQEICDKLGVDRNKLPNRLYSTLLDEISNCCEGGGGSGGGGSEAEWQPNPTWWDIKTILENDTRDYTYKAVILLLNNDKSTTLKGGIAYATSDGSFYETSSVTHTWDKTQDKQCYDTDIPTYKTRYYIIYSDAPITIALQPQLLYFVCSKDLFNNKTDMSYMLYNLYLLHSIPELDTSNVTNMSYMFNNCFSLKSIPELNTSNVTDMAHMFKACYSLQRIPELDTSNVTNVSNMFNNCPALQSIPKLDLRNATNVSSMFTSCRSLIHLKLLNIKVSGITLSSATSYGHLLTVDSLINTIKELWDYSSGTTTYTLTLGTLNIDKLPKVYVKLITPTAEQIAADPNIENKMPCEVCESTDEGAMLILDYAGLKNWEIS